NGSVLAETVVDTVTGATFSHNYSLNLAQVIGGNFAYVGFTGATGGENATQQILNWKGGFAAPTPRREMEPPASATARPAVPLTARAVDANGLTNPGYTGTVHFASSDAQAGLPGNYTFTTGAAADNGVHTFTVTLKTAGTQTITVNDTTQNKLI